MEITDFSGDRWAIARAGARGLVASMAMTGIRTVTAGMGPHEKSPPEAIIEKHAPQWVREMPDWKREALTELAHWSYGSAGGVLFGFLPGRVRGHPISGPVYGLAIWLAFELGLAPMLKVEHTQHRTVAWRVGVALDHLIYGIVVAGRLAPEPAARP